MAANNGSGDDDAGKMFIGGVSRETTEPSLRTYFEQYGSVKDCILMTDKATGNSRGFGFVTFTNPSSVDEVIKACPHTLDNKRIDPKKCTPRHMQQKKNQGTYGRTHKIFVGGLSMEATEEDVKTYFSKYGVITEIVFVSDKNDTSRPHKGFGFVTFEDESSVDQAIAKHYHVIKDKRCEAKSAESKDKLNQMKVQGGGYNQNKMMNYDQNKMNYCPPNMPNNCAYPNMNNMYNAGPPAQGPYMPGNQMGPPYNAAYNNPSFPTAYPQQYPNQCNYNQGYPNQAYGYPYNGINQPSMNMHHNNSGGPPNQSMPNSEMSSGNAGAYMNPGSNATNYPNNMGRGDGMGNNYQQSNSGYGPIRTADYSASANSSQPQAPSASAPNTMPPNNNAGYSQGKASANSAASGYHPYRRA